MDEEGQQSPEAGRETPVIPRKNLVLEDENLQVPFSELHGERVEYVGKAEDAIIALSSYRLHIKFKESVTTIPLQLVESVECRDMFQLHVICKECKVIRCQFSSAEQCQEWLKRLTAVVRPPARLDELFSFAFHTWCMKDDAEDAENHGEMCRAGDHVIHWFKNEVERMGFDAHHAWRITDINRGYRLCSSYPEQLLVPVWVTDKELENIAAFRSWKRFPAVVYRHQSTGAVIGRCGQPEVSWWGWRNADDEQLIQSIARACSMDKMDAPLTNGSCDQKLSNGTLPSSISAVTNGTSETEPVTAPSQKLLILDARSYAAAVANRAKGGGCECPEYYPNCEVLFMGMANIHSIRKSFQCLRSLCAQVPDPANWLSSLEGTKWLQHLSLLLKAALLVVNTVDRDRRPVLVHCSDGWDRTPQIVALSKLLLDPFYRTIKGFQVLVQTEWLDFGHKFADRCGHGEDAEDLNERCPVFLQWLDCVHQLQRQFPCSFEFNEAFLVKLVQHTYSCRFGTFLCNSRKEREKHSVLQRTCSVWSLLRPENRAFWNILYSPHSEMVLHPVCHVRNLMLWSAVYLPSSSPSTPTEDSCAPYPTPKTPSEETNGRLPKTRSFDNLPSVCDGGPASSNRCSSDPNLNDMLPQHLKPLGVTVASELEASENLQRTPDSPEQRLEEEVMGKALCNGEASGELNNTERKEVETCEEAELSVAVDVTEGQIEHILQEAREEGGAETMRQDVTVCAPPMEDSDYLTSSTLTTPSPTELNSDVPSQQPKAQLPKEMLDASASESSHVPLLAGDPITNGDSESQSEEVSPSSSCCVDGVLAPNNALPEQFEGNKTVLHSLTDTEAAPEPSPCTRTHLSQEPPRTLNGLCSPTHGALPPLSSSSGQDRHICNGKVPNGVNGARTPLSRQTSIASASSVTNAHGHLLGGLARGPCGTLRTTGPSHLDEDGLSVHSDAVQVRLRQMEAGHQLQVETLKRQVQELWSRLRVSRELPGEMSSVPDSENNELFSDGSWEKVEQQDPEGTRWYPDHIGAHCYGCETKLWLAARKHHCRNCGNVFCASCCDQKVAVPSQQLFEPNRVCKACYSHLRLTSVPPAVPPADLELEKPITASSN
ncbi:myotubularin-related protein 3-like isoform X2 [Denticeps clupeoides]|uniref:phosphatidylinositol-3,5-bisphosphate 3-phosphatase n=1 Tax=Denticeps clupeoides TaxID=299321 RepID=A0AAY4E377_9TELE|nr:myotubularin-related protein 3-like isoform X2 [Denticeps clupeoides]